jgi:spermidine/putrescine ABC transporter ATP-binding subunit
LSNAQTNNPIIKISHISKDFGAVNAVDDVSFEIMPNEFFALLGPSGCGKTTLLRLIAGLESPTHGTISIDGENMDAIPANRRPVNMVFQSYAVFPHMTVYNNVAYGLKVAKICQSDIRQRVIEAIDSVQMGEYVNRRPDELSGGQRQRVALARALVKRPKVLLLDEPLSALDAKLRKAMQLELMQLQRKVGITFIIVTHDQDEALSMADRIAVMDRGVVRQIATPNVIYESPTTRFVADFIGKVNLIDAHVIARNKGKLLVDVKGLGTMEIFHKNNTPDSVTIALRPEKIVASKRKPQTKDRISTKGRVHEQVYYGNISHLYVNTEAGLRLLINIQNASRSTVDLFGIDDDIWLSFYPSDAIIITN